MPAPPRKAEAEAKAKAKRGRGCFGGSPIMVLLPLLVMAAIGVGIALIVRYAAAPKAPVVPLMQPMQPSANAQMDYQLARERDVDQLYHQTVEQLGSDKGEVRIGALYTLERLARENPKLYAGVCGTLEGYIRVGLDELPDDLPQHKLSGDIQVAQTILGRMKAYAPPTGA